jgi:hypothetical protein
MSSQRFWLFTKWNETKFCKLQKKFLHKSFPHFCKTLYNFLAKFSKMPKINKFEILWKQLCRCSFKNLHILDKFSHLKILVSRCKYESLRNWPWFYEVVHNIFKNYIARLCFMLLNCVNFIISMGISNFHKLLLSPKLRS